MLYAYADKIKYIRSFENSIKDISGKNCRFKYLTAILFLSYIEGSAY